MDVDNQQINIVKVQNFPYENQQIELDCDILIDINQNSYIIEEDKLKKFFGAKIELNQMSKETNLFVEDDRGNKYTLHNFKWWFFSPAFTIYICFSFDMIIFDNHIDFDVEKKEIKKITAQIKSEKQIDLDFYYEGKDIKTNSIYSEYNLSSLAEDWGEGVANKIYTGICECIIEAKEEESFVNLDLILRRLMEYVFLFKLNRPSYNTLYIYTKNKTYMIKTNRRIFNDKIHCWYCKEDKEEHIRFFNSKYLDFNQRDFANFVKFRKDSGFIFDVFRTTIYSDSFIEDYPLRLSQTLEGLANFLKIADTDSNKDTFKSAISKSLLTNNDVYKFFDLDGINQFCKKITEHRNKFSHVKQNGNYLNRDDCEEFSQILCTTIRILIIKKIKEIL